MAKERDKNPNYPILKIINVDIFISRKRNKNLICLPSCFELGEKLRDVTVLR